jgi:hypothetical protein
MIRWFADEWEITPLGWKIFLFLMAVVCLVNIGEGIYAAPDGLSAVTVGIARIFRAAIVLILPFILATKARRRGRRFGLWLILAMLFNPIVVGIIYWVIVRKEQERPA